MKAQNYEEYMREVLGYQEEVLRNNEDTYCPDVPMNQEEEYLDEMRDEDMSIEMLEQLYPELYRIIYPMVTKICSENTRRITEEVLQEMINEIYSNVEPDDPEMSLPPLKNGDVRNPNAKEELEIESRQRNRTLEDLIRILLLRELIGGGIPVFPIRPPFRPRPPHRPPMKPPHRYDDETGPRGYY